MLIVSLQSSGNSGIGVTGIMQEASLMCLKILGEGGTDSSNIDAYHYAIRKKARVINNSWGSNPDEPPTPDSGLFQRGAGDFEAKKNLYGPVSREVQRAGIINVWAAGLDRLLILHPGGHAAISAQHLAV